MKLPGGGVSTIPRRSLIWSYSSGVIRVSMIRAIATMASSIDAKTLLPYGGRQRGLSLRRGSEVAFRSGDGKTGRVGLSEAVASLVVVVPFATRRRRLLSTWCDRRRRRDVSRQMPV